MSSWVSDLAVLRMRSSRGDDCNGQARRAGRRTCLRCPVERVHDGQTLLAAGAKPSFLLWDKVYQKVNDILDETWLLHASEEVIPFFKDELLKKEHAS